MAGRQSTYIARFRNVSDKHQDFLRGYGFQGGSGSAEYPGPRARRRRASASAFKKTVRDLNPDADLHRRLRRSAGAAREPVELDPAVKDAWGIPVLRFDYRFGENELAMAKDMADTAEEMLRAAGAEDMNVSPSDILTEGWSIHEMGTARMGIDPEDVGHQLRSARPTTSRTCSSSTAACSSRRRARTRPG